MAQTPSRPAIEGLSCLVEREQNPKKPSIAGRLRGDSPLLKLKANH